MLMDLIQQRHSTRNYTDEQIQSENLEKILAAGNYAPDAGGGRGRETFDDEAGRQMMREWNVREGYACQGFVILGYIDGPQPSTKQRKEGRIQIIS